MMEKKLLIIGNWKMYKDCEQACKFMKVFTQLYEKNLASIPKNLEFGIAPNFVCLKTVLEKAPLNFILTAQNLSNQSEAALTGETSAQMLVSAGAKMVIIGHSERRIHFHETDQMISEKVVEALNNKLTPILCVGETLEQYQNNQGQKVVKQQLEQGLKGIKDIKNLKKVVIAYEPVWAIGTGKTATPEEAQKMCHYIRSLTTKDMIIQYGGSVNETNIALLISQPDIDGALVGSASLNPEKFVQMLTINHALNK